MKDMLKKYENILLLLSLFLFASVLLANTSKDKLAPNMLERMAMAISAPIQAGVTSSIRSAISAYSHYVNLVGVSRENEVLREQLNAQRLQNNLLLEELKKYRRLEDLLSFHKFSRKNLLVANVVGWDSTMLAQTLVLDRGVEEGVKEGAVALTHEGLVGRVVSVTKKASRVLMITDARSAVDVYAQERRTRAMVMGQNKNKCIIRYLPIDAEVEKGDLLISSGLGGIYPKGLPVGRIASLEPGKNRLFYRATLVPAADLKHLEEVLLLLDNGEDERGG